MLRILILFLFVVVVVDSQEEVLDGVRLRTKITYDVEPVTQEDKSCRIRVAPLGVPESGKFVEEGDLIEPGRYIFHITKEAYEPLDIVKEIPCGHESFVLEERLVAKKVPLDIDISYDVAAPYYLDECTVSLISQTGELHIVASSQKIKPGEYALEVQRLGYHFGPPKIITIHPSEKSFVIKEHLIAMPRNLCYDIEDRNRCLIPSYAIINAATMEEISFQDKFPAGSDVDVIILFRKYGTIRKQITIVPGQGPMIIQANIIPLRSYEIGISIKPRQKYKLKFHQDHIELDEIKYFHQVYVDSHAIEPHLISSFERGVGAIFCDVYMPRKAKKMRVSVGFLFAEKDLSKVDLRAMVFDRIDIKAFIGHLNQVAENQGNRLKSLEILEKILQTENGRELMGSCDAKELETLKGVVNSWDQGVSSDGHKRLQVISEQIRDLQRIK